jgi:hypothetical protein
VGKGDDAGAIMDCKQAVELNGTNVFFVAYDQGLIDFINGDYKGAIVFWQKVIEHDSTLKLELQPWIEKAQAKLQNKTP